MLFVENAEIFQYLVDAPQLHSAEEGADPLRKAMQFLSCKAVISPADEILW